MSIERWDPFRELRLMREAVDRLFQDNVARPMGSILSEWAGSVPVDVSENDMGFTVRATIPGVRPEDIQLNIQGDRLTLRAESQAERERREENYLVRERHATAYFRTLTLPAPVDGELTEARYEHGVLTITMPKALPGKTSQIKVRGGDESASRLEPGEPGVKGA